MDPNDQVAIHEGFLFLLLFIFLFFFYYLCDL
jgi:hypothetical protein